MPHSHTHQINSHDHGAHTHQINLTADASDPDLPFTIWKIGPNGFYEKLEGTDAKTYTISSSPFYGKALGESPEDQFYDFRGIRVAPGRPGIRTDVLRNVGGLPPSDDPSSPNPEPTKIPTDTPVPANFRVVERYRVVTWSLVWANDTEVWSTRQGAEDRARQLLFARKDVLRCEIECFWEREEQA